MSLRNDLNIPAAADVDYSDVGTICGYAQLLVRLLGIHGGLDSPAADNAEVREIRRQGVVWLREVKALVESIFASRTDSVRVAGLETVPDLVHVFDMMHRIARGTSCHEYLRSLKIRTADRWAKCDKSISATDVALLLLSEIDRDISGVRQRYVDFALGELVKWVEELAGYGQFRGIPLSEAYARLTYLLDADLSFSLGGKEKQRREKTRWVGKYILEDLSGLDSPAMMKYIAFALTACRCGFYLPAQEDELYSRLWSGYISRPDVNPMFRQAIRLTLCQPVE